MAGMVYTRYGGLVLAEQGADESSVRRALKDFDRQLRLTTEVSPEHGCQVYRVFKQLPDREAVWICDWRDESGAPMPLTHRLVDRVKELAVGSRAPQADPFEHNERIRQQTRDEYRELLDEQVRDGVRRAKRAPCFKPGQYLRLSRDKQRAKGHNL